MNAAKHAATRYRGSALAALIGLIAVGLAAYAAAASYDTVSGQALARHLPLAWLNPIGLDGGLFGIIIFDITLTWWGHPIWWLRFAARLFAVGTVAANASAGWPDPVGIGLRIAAPSLFVLIVEAGRTVLLRSRRDAEVRARAAAAARRRAAREQRRGDRIPPMRWLLDFRGTLAIWKRMQLWREPSYAKAVSMELDRLAAIEKLGMRYGAGWQEKAPADLAWMITTGVRMTEALVRVTELCAAPEPVTVPVKAESPARKPRPATGNGKGGSGTRKGTGSSVRATVAARPEAPAVSADDLPGNWGELDTEARVLFLVNEKGYSASKAGLAADVTDARGRQIVRMARDLGATAPQDVVSETQ